MSEPSMDITVRVEVLDVSVGIANTALGGASNLVAGEGITITGSGTAEDPYVITNTGGGGEPETDFFYLRPGGVDSYRRPGGIDTYIRP